MTSSNVSELQTTTHTRKLFQKIKKIKNNNKIFYRFQAGQLLLTGIP